MTVMSRAESQESGLSVGKKMSREVISHGEKILLKTVLSFYISLFSAVGKESLIKMIHSHCGKYNSFLVVKRCCNIFR